MKGNRAFFKLAAWLGGALLLYILSVGPAMRFSRRTYFDSPSPILDTIWSPVLALHHTSVAPLLEGYLAL